MRKNNNRFVRGWRIRSGHERPAPPSGPAPSSPASASTAAVPVADGGAVGSTAAVLEQAEPAPRKRKAKRAEAVEVSPIEVASSAADPLAVARAVAEAIPAIAAAQPAPLTPADEISLEELERLTAPAPEA